MNGNVDIRLGSSLDHPCDMAVLSCSTAGTVNRFVADLVAKHKLPKPRFGMKLGSIDVRESPESAELPRYIAWAASVSAHISTYPALRSIGRELGTATAVNAAIRQVSVPLLGTGAGRLDPAKALEAFRDGFISTAAPDAKLSVFVLQEDVYVRLREEFGVGRPTEANTTLITKQFDPPRVLVTYSSPTDGEDDEEVKWLATMLRSRGINARLDIWHLGFSHDIYLWMKRELELAQRVIIVSDEAYAAKADSGKGGVGFETQAIKEDLAGRAADDFKYMCIARCASLEAGVPAYLKSRFWLHWCPLAARASRENKVVKEILGQTDEPPIALPSP